MLTKPQPTDEQVSILDAVRSSKENLQIRALAGTGKTSTLEMIEGEIDGPILCLAFNKRIAEEMEKRFKTTTTVRTFNSLGHRIWARATANNLSLDAKKCNKILAEHIKTLKGSDKEDAWEVFWEVLATVGLAKALGYVPEGVYPNAKRLCDRSTLLAHLDERPSPLSQRLVDWVLTESIRAAYEGYIDFNDQIYMPALFGGTFPRYPLILVDEAQDLSPTNHQMLTKQKGSRIISVGDPYQSIYAFRGAAQGGMDRMAAAYAMRQADLSISFRCPQAIVENVKWRVPWFRWHQTGGHVEQLIQPTLGGFSDSCAIICRNNAPLFRLAFNLLSSGRSVRVAGSDIGPKLVGILRKLGSETLPRPAVLAAIALWQAEKEDRGSTTAADMADSMRTFASKGANLGQCITYAEHLFKQTGTINLLTGHKAKGLEFDTVYHLDPWLIRGGQDQEDNLRYVIDTRARERLFYINSVDFQ